MGEESHPGGVLSSEEMRCGGKRMRTAQTRCNSIKMFTPERNEVTLNRDGRIDLCVRKDPEQSERTNSK